MDIKLGAKVANKHSGLSLSDVEGERQEAAAGASHLRKHN